MPRHRYGDTAILQRANFPNNSHGKGATLNIAKFLYGKTGLKQRYAEKLISTRIHFDHKSHSIPFALHNLIEYLLNNEPFKNDEHCNAVISFLIASTKEPFNVELDRVTFWELEEERDESGVLQQMPITVDMILREDIGLICAALLDEEVYPEKTTEDKKDRILTFFNEAKSLATSSKICHTGIRHSLTLTLNYVFPNTIIIEDIDSFLHDLTKQFIQSLLNSYKKKSISEHNRLMLVWMESGEMPPSLLEFFYNPFILKLFRNFLENNCKHHGLNTDEVDIKTKIDAYCLPEIVAYLNAPLGTNVLLHKINFFLQCQDCKDINRNKVITGIKQLIKTYPIDSPLFLKLLTNIKKVEIARELLARYGDSLKYWDAEIINIAELEELKTKIEQYFEVLAINHLVKDSITGDDFNFLLDKLSLAVNKFKQDKFNNWLINYFANFYSADLSEMIILSENLQDLATQEKIQVNEAWLEAVFTPRVIRIEEGEMIIRGEVEITPYEINKIFLHAIITPVNNWSSTFYKYFKLVRKFVVDSFAQEAVGIVQQLSKSSYPPHLMKHLLYLEIYFSKLEAHSTEQADILAAEERLLYAEADALLLSVDKIDQVDRFGRSLLLRAVWNGWTNVVNVFISLGANINVSYESNSLLLLAAKLQYPVIVEKLLSKLDIATAENKADILNVISFAAEHGLATVMEVFINSSLAIDYFNTPNRHGYTPLMLAIKYGHLDIVKLILSKEGIDISHKLSDVVGGYNALLLAVEEGDDEIVEEILNYNSSNIDDKLANNKGGFTALMLAAKKGLINVVEALLEIEDININEKNPSGYTALYLAASEGKILVVDLLLSKEETLVNEVSILERDGATALTIAAMKRHDEIVIKLLYKDGIDIYHCDRYGKSVFDYVLDYKQPELIKSLLYRINRDFTTTSEKNMIKAGSFIAKAFDKDAVLCPIFNKEAINTKAALQAYLSPELIPSLVTLVNSFKSKIKSVIMCALLSRYKELNLENRGSRRLFGEVSRGGDQSSIEFVNKFINFVQKNKELPPEIIEKLFSLLQGNTIELPEEAREISDEVPASLVV